MIQVLKLIAFRTSAKNVLLCELKRNLRGYKMNKVKDETKQDAYRLCREFLGGSWKNLGYNDFGIEPVSGGLSNLLYTCAIENDSFPTMEHEPRKVLLRIYGQIIREHPETVVKDSVIFALLSERGMGPRLYGVFTGGRVEEYIKSRHLKTSELHIPKISLECAKIMASFHQMKMPLCKEPKWLFDTIDGYMKDAVGILNSPSRHIKKEELLEKYRTLNLEEELKMLKHILNQVDSPVVFCHNDMQEGNILLQDGMSIYDENLNLIPIDFEYAHSNMRGFDMGNHFCEWCYNYHEVDEYPYYRANIEDYPSQDNQLQFVRMYIAAMGLDKEEGYDASLTEQQIMLEANAYALASHFLWGLWSIIQANISTIEFGYLEYGLDRFQHYFYQKEKLPRHILITAARLVDEESG